MSTKSHTARYYLSIWDSPVLKNEVLYTFFKKADSTGESLQLIVPCNLHNDIMIQMHDSVTAGHMGTKRT
jgi:hypothetical protein